ncbi:MAG: M28 family peptidase [Candidatus Nealsonbacteria bacterium]|nr:M28 family peptidase [Candidatus Nealsonbacteria bacterium]
MKKRIDNPKRTRRFSTQTTFLVAVVVGGCLVFSYIFWTDRGSGDDKHASQLQLNQIPFNGTRAYGYLKQLCEIGPRRSGSPGMAAQQKLLEEHFRKRGGQVRWQRFETEHPENGSKVPIANLIVHWHPQRTERVLLCTHYDTLPFPMLDPKNKRGRFVGANDGASGVAVLMELANEMPKLNCKYGVDFVLFDAEEFLFREDGRFFIGSEHFARQYVSNPPTYRYRFGVLLDMIGDKDLRIYQESYSMSWDDSRPLVKELWATADRLGVQEFVAQRGDWIRDDHVSLHEIAGIPCCNIIDFDYPPWHTQNDVPEMCSPLSLAKVGWVIREWLREE